ncbi:phage tail protein [uncultured Mediterranean phage uvMED]|nr:phage tail protein [uncultured Mediterranean phage uvMED]
MRYQAIRAAIESPLQTAFGALSPAVPVFFDGITAAPANATTEYVRVNVTFGLTTEVTLTSNLDFVRGSVVIRVYSEKGKGPARNQTLLDTAVTTLTGLSASTRDSSGIYLRPGAINGPTFSAEEASPHFVGRIDASFTAEDQD